MKLHSVIAASVGATAWGLLRPAPWKMVPAPISGDEVVNPIFMLRHDPTALARLEEFVADVSSPGHANYGQYLSASELKSLLTVQTGALEAVLAFFSEHNVSSSMLSVSLSGDMVSAKIPVSKAKDMFRTDFYKYTHPLLRKSAIRAGDGLTLPSEVRAAVYTIGNLLELPNIDRIIRVPELSDEPVVSGGFGSDCSGCTNRVTPAVLADAYKFSLEGGATTSLIEAVDSGMATAEFTGVYYDENSLGKFQTACKLPFAVEVDKQIGDNYQWHCQGGDPCTEALLDIEYIKATSGGINLTNIYTSEYSYMDWAKQVDDLGDAAPAVHSISYGDDEVQQDDDAPSGMSGDDYMFAINAQFAKLAAKGISVLVASGDQGVCGRTGCRSTFHPDFPASSPYVTAVGGTDFLEKSQVGEEKAWRSSGGGFSNTFGQPTWQKRAVENYLSSNASGAGLPPAVAFNSSGRAYPDVSALGGEQNPFCVAEKMFPGIEHMAGVAGTSASTPVFAGLVARLNKARVANSLPRMGLLNPWLYEHPEVFGDVVHGKNSHNGDDGFEAAAGWDPATGLGTPRFDAMLAAALSDRSAVSLV